MESESSNLLTVPLAALGSAESTPARGAEITATVTGVIVEIDGESASVRIDQINGQPSGTAEESGDADEAEMRRKAAEADEAGEPDDEE